MVLAKDTGGIRHLRFSEFPEELAAGDLLVLNDTKVLPARLRGHKPTGGAIELLLLEREDETREGRLEALIAGGKSLRPGTELTLGPGLRAVVLARDEDVWRVRLTPLGQDASAAIEAAGEVPLPPYIHRERRRARRSDRDAIRRSSPRAGARSRRRRGLAFHAGRLGGSRAGVETAFVTLHVGSGDVRPVAGRVRRRPRMHDEAFEIPRATAEAVLRTRARGGRVVAVGTTVVRTLESRADDRGVTPGSGRSGLFVYPGFRFRIVDALVTNFHLPRSTLLMLVCAFAGTESVLAAYRLAVKENYRFFSYGDAMFVRAR
jgi:S-adenosylmethionine:tRNA ribosyltransferase-isomerase